MKIEDEEVVIKGAKQSKIKNNKIVPVDASETRQV